MTMDRPVSRDMLLPLRLALREMRGGLRGFYVFISCIALGVMAIAGIGSFSESLSAGLSREGRTIIGGDIAFSLIQREASHDEQKFLAESGQLSVAATMRAMARTDDERRALVEIKAVDAAYPLYGAVALAPAMPLAEALAGRDGIFGAAADSALLARLDLAPGAEITIGKTRLVIRASIRSEPDKLAGGIGFGPRLLISEAALRASGLLQPGSLVRWHYRLLLPGNDASEQAADALSDKAERLFPDAGWEIRRCNNAAPQLERNIERFTQFLTLVGLTALLVGGIGIANAVKSHLARRRNSIAVMKALGATGGRIFSIYLTQVLLLSTFGAGIGLLLGATMPFVIAELFGDLLPLPLAPDLQPATLALGLLYGLTTTLAFALWPLGRAHDIPVSALFRDQVEQTRRAPRAIYIVTAIAVAGLLIALAIFLAYDRRIAALFVASAGAIFVALRLVAFAIMAIASRLPHARITTLRMAIANIHRPGALTPTVVLSLGLGVALLVTVIQIDGNLARQFRQGLPDRAPAFFFVDIQSADAERFDAFVASHVPDGKLERVPMLRGRITAVNNIRAEDLKIEPQASWVLQSDRGITYAADIPEGSRIVDGAWWAADYRGPPLVSLEKRIADGLGLKIGDTITVNVLGRNIAATLANTRAVDWQTLGINFVLVYSPGAFAGAPHTHLATLTYPQGSNLPEEIALLKDMARDFPTVSIVRVKEALDAAGALVSNLVLAIRGASVVTLLAAALVLAGALAASHQSRVYDAVILKTLGATRARLVGAYALEYALLGLVTALFGVVTGSLAAWMVVTRLMRLDFVFLPWPALVAAGAALLLTIVLGLIGTYGALGQRPAPVLRNL